MKCWLNIRAGFTQWSLLRLFVGVYKTNIKPV